MIKADYREQLIAVGKELYLRGLQTTRSGNISVRIGERFLITKTGSNLGRLSESDLIAVETPQCTTIPAGASCESPVHRSIYNATDARAIVHAHPIHALALAQISNGDNIRPIHNEGLVGLKRIPIVGTTVPGDDSGEEPCAITMALSEWCSVVVRNHGAFTVGTSLDQALYKMLLLEDTCHMVFLVQSVKSARSNPSIRQPRHGTDPRPSGDARAEDTSRVFAARSKHLILSAAKSELIKRK
jgi:L-fuculose-phosphate aldolase